MKRARIGNCEIFIYKTHDEAGRAVAEEIIHATERALTRSDSCCLCLAGGRTILTAEAALAQHPQAIHWGRVKFFFTDEHIVPSDSPENNFALARPHLEPLVARGLKVYPIRTTRGSRLLTWAEAQAEARRYERTIKRSLGPQQIFDLVILGLGADRHIASLLPEKEGFSNPAFASTRWVEAVHYPRELYPGVGLRITLTPRAFAQSAQVLLFVTGSQKREALQSALTGPQELNINPGSLIALLPNAKVITDSASWGVPIEGESKATSVQPVISI
jgi:6-phosphogluconolactonase